ncbi:cell division control protein 6 homolog [Dendronephthya gigantea]|uniref:cell division control protein 6 homolog n=1 Tax=Dendronephthya gigantea TaxID=151771 RepID=UPI00106D76C3|nr:cell division control protein 6 homolog [Dendronephthya gigantea]
MVKTRSQQKIGFPKRKAKPVRKVIDDESKTRSCCIAKLTRACRDKPKGVESLNESWSSSAKKSMSASHASALQEYEIIEMQKENLNEPCRKTRRILSYKENEDTHSNIQGTLTKNRELRQQPTANNEVQKPSSKGTTMKVPDIVVHSPIKTRSNAVLSQSSPLKCSLRLERTVPKKLTLCRSAGHLSPSQLTTPQRKRRHSSSSDHEKTSVQNKNTELPAGSPLANEIPKSLSDTCLENVTPNRQMLCLKRQEVISYKETKKALHSSIPSNLLCRETEIRQIGVFLRSHLMHCKAGSLYISGAPGTGKTACLTHILENLQEDGVKCQVQFINCMNLSKSHRIYSKIAEELTGWDKLTNNEAQKFLEKKFTTKGLPMVVVLDEMDQLESKNQDVLYTMFEWPSLPSSRLILIGIANALDLTDRVLPRLQLRQECKPKLLHFSPYAKDQIVKILTARLSEVEGSNIIDVSAIQFCARKIAAVSGDMRKALNICRRAVEMVESEVKKQQILKPIDQRASPKKPGQKKVTIAHISKVISEVYGSRIVNSCGGEQPTIPLQQKLLICTILLMQKESKLREIPVGQLHETYCNICKKRQVSQINQEDCLSLCNLLETRGIISMKRAKETRMTKVSLKIDEREVDHALQDKILMTSILQGGLSPGR